MITCTICGHANEDLAITCLQCKSYLQAKVENLDLFDTAWRILSSPGAGFRRVALARSKNYGLLLSSLMGMSLVYGVLWYARVGRIVPDLGLLLGSGLVAGPFVGVGILLVLALYLRSALRFVGGKGTVRNNWAVAAYAMIPVVLSLVVVFPLEFALFGKYLFDQNPSPAIIDPTRYLLLLGLDAAAALWSLLLLVPAASAANSVSRMKAAGAVAGGAGLAAAALAAVGAF